MTRKPQRESSLSSLEILLTPSVQQSRETRTRKWDDTSDPGRSSSESYVGLGSFVRRFLPNFTVPEK
jgi:hypothetical protein